MKFTTKVVVLILAISGISIIGGFYSSLKGDKVPQQEMLNASEKSQIVEILEEDLINGVDSIVDRYRQHYHFSGQVLVNYKGYRVFQENVGYSNPKKRTSIDSNKAYQLASVSKQFTAMATMMLAESNELSYDDRVVKYFPSFPYRDITLRHLLNHTSGLPNYMWLIEKKYSDTSQAYNDDVIDLLAEYELYLNFKPGTRFSYSNTGYVILASIVEKASGKRFDIFLKDRIFEPLNMNNSFVFSKALNKLYPSKVEGYRGNGHYYRPVPYNEHDGIVGDKGVYSTAEDLYKWDQALYNNKLIPKHEKEEAFQRATLKNGNQVDYGYGFRLEEQNGKKVVYHNGLWNGFRTSVKRHVEDTFTVIALNNTDSEVKGDLVRNLEQYLQANADRSKMHKLVMSTIEGASEPAIDQLKALQTQNSQWFSMAKMKQVIHFLESHDKQKMAQKLSAVQARFKRIMADNPHHENANHRKEPHSGSS